MVSLVEDSKLEDVKPLIEKIRPPQVKHKTFLIQDLEKKEFYTVSEYAEKINVSFNVLKKRLNQAFKDVNRPDIRVDVTHEVFQPKPRSPRTAVKPKGILYLLPGNVFKYSFSTPEGYLVALNLKTRTLKTPDGVEKPIEWEVGTFPGKKKSNT